MGNELSPGPFPRGLFLFSAKHSPSMSGGIYHSITRFARSVPLVSFAFVSFLLHPPVRCLHPNTANERSFFSSSGIIGSLKELLRSGQSFIGILSDPLSPAIANRRRLVCASARASSQDAFIRLSEDLLWGLWSRFYRVCVKMWLSYRETLDSFSCVKTRRFLFLKMNLRFDRIFWALKFRSDLSANFSLELS